MWRTVMSKRGFDLQTHTMNIPDLEGSDRRAGHKLRQLQVQTRDTPEGQRRKVKSNRRETHLVHKLEPASPRSQGNDMPVNLS